MLVFVMTGTYETERPWYLSIFQIPAQITRYSFVAEISGCNLQNKSKARFKFVSLELQKDSLTTLPLFLLTTVIFISQSINQAQILFGLYKDGQLGSFFPMPQTPTMSLLWPAKNAVLREHENTFPLEHIIIQSQKRCNSSHFVSKSSPEGSVVLSPV